MTIDVLPYLLLLIAIALAWISTIQKSLIALALAVLAGLSLGRLSWISLPSILALAGLIWWPRRLPRGDLNWLAKGICYGLFLILATALSNYLVPGFYNLPIYQNVQFSPDSIPFSMYLNFDKTLVGLFVILFFTRTSISDLRFVHIRTALLILALLVALLMPVALSIHYVCLDLKFPDLGWLWILNNLFFVCVAEEGLFRGFIQKGLQNIFPKTKIYAGFSIVMASTLFGLAHYKGGLAYVALAGIAGLFYGYAFQKTNRLEASITVHFGLNLIHFLFFSYPALAA